MSLSDQNLDLLLAETRWGYGGVHDRITASPDPVKFRAFWCGLTLYRLALPEFRHRFDRALEDASRTSAWSIHIQSVIQAKHDMMRAPGDFPFCLSNVQWGEHCQARFSGQIDTIDYTPPNVLRDTMALVIKTIFATGAAMFVATLLPEEIVTGGTIAAVSGRAVARGTLLAAANTAMDHLLPTTNPMDDYSKGEVDQRYMLENRRRKLP